MLKLYNTATKKLETFWPESPAKTTIYTCGPTVYSEPHLGNLAAYCYWDLLIRVLQLEGFNPYRVLNLTDVGHLTSDGDEGEDKLEKGAKREGKTVWEIADFYIDRFKKAYRALALYPPHVLARATDYIEDEKALVEALIKNGYTYETSDGIYFDTSKFKNYADFARLDLDHQKAGARVAFSSEKKNPSDFAVWKFIKPGEKHAMRWDFLGRPGYPGWHLECSAIIHKELGEPIDIHCGGIDHIPVHHTNEIAETFGAYQEKLANYWLHCNFLKIDGEKISKSLGNLITLDDLDKKGFSPLDFKLWIYQGHYRSERNFSWSDLEAARNRRLKWRNAYARAYQLSGTGGDAILERLEFERPVESEEFVKKLLSLLDDDLNSPSALAYIDEHLDGLTTADWIFLDAVLFHFDDSFPLCPTGEPTKEDELEHETHSARTEVNIEAELRPLINRRNRARKDKDFEKADALRKKIEEKGFSLLDTDSITFWQYTK